MSEQLRKKSTQRIPILPVILILLFASIPHAAQAAITCPSGYQCMAETGAAALWGPGNYIQFSSDACGADVDLTVYYYCYAQKPVTTTFTSTPVTTTMTQTVVTTIITPVAGRPLCSPPSCKPGEILYCPGQCPNSCGLQCRAAVAACTLPSCKPGEILYCPGQCPGGCGLQCRAAVAACTPPSCKPGEILYCSGQCPAGCGLQCIPAFQLSTGTPTDQVNRSSYLGFDGLTFNADGQNSLFIDLSLAKEADAVIVQYADRVEVYQGYPRGIKITFWGDQFVTTGKTITGRARFAEFETDPLVASLYIGNVSGSLRAILPGLTRRAVITTVISGNVSPDISDQFRTALADNNLTMDAVAFTFAVQKTGLPMTGAANVSMGIPVSWVDQHGGNDLVYISRISETTGMPELLQTTFKGTDSQGTMFFLGDSPNGSSIFGLIVAKATAVKQQKNPDITIQPLQIPAITTDIGIFSWLISMMMQYPLPSIVAISAILAISGIVWRFKK